MGSMQFNSKLQLYLLTIHVGRTTRVRYIRLKKMKNCGRFVPDGEGGVYLGILGGRLPPCSQNLHPISDQKVSFSTPIFCFGL